MMTLEELEKIRKEALERVQLRKERTGTRIVVGMATCGISAGARPVLEAIMDEVSKRGLSDVVVSQTGCIGLCKYEPIVEVLRPGENKVTYIKMDPEKAKKMIAEHIVNGHVVKEWTIESIQL
ncbi:MAG: (2Fe-2S) ferredoxin domain-containing protein [Thermoanaerobacteraceae bacterium]|nr:(2Fe-2S) ferredoxin domain-containing protein [Thermoanaerobacteraceae bacterium]